MTLVGSSLEDIMAHDYEPGWYDLLGTIRRDIRVAQQWWLRPCDACGAIYRVQGAEVELLLYCDGTRCKRDS
jgi:hypothetical protein